MLNYELRITNYECGVLNYGSRNIEVFPALDKAGAGGGWILQIIRFLKNSEF